MSDLDALLKAILANPEDDTVRLVYADALEENGQAERAEFIRLQIKLAAGCPVCDGTGRNVMSPCNCSLLRTREQELIMATSPGGEFRNWVTWFEPFRRDCVPDTNGGEVGSHYGWRYSRGFVDSIRMSAELWVAHADAIYWHPSQTLTCCVCRGAGYVGEERFGCERCGKGKPKFRGNGRMPRPCPPAAHPVREVTLTTWPDGGLFPMLDVHRIDRKFTSPRWPGITFTLPPEPV